MSRGLAKRVVELAVVLGAAAGAFVLPAGSLTEATGSGAVVSSEPVAVAAGPSPSAMMATPPPSIAPAPTPAPTPAATSTPSPTTTPTPTTTPAPPPIPNPRVLADVNAARSVGGKFPSDSVTEPTVAMSPFDPSLAAVVYQRLTGNSSCGLDTGISISRDGGRTWKPVSGRPWRGTHRGPNYHGVIAWGPGPTPGSSRLWWADTTVPSCDYSAHSVSVSYSDNLGRTWAPLYVERRTPPWIGGFPDITVDDNPASPNFGVVYVAYNWLADPQTGPGLAVLASADGGHSWQMAQVGAVGLSGYPDAWRIGYRIRTAPDGSAFVACYEAAMRHWNQYDPFASGGLDNVGRVGFAVARLRYDRAAHRLSAGAAVWALTLAHNSYTVIGSAAPGTTNVLSPDPRWQIGLDVDQASGRLFMAVSDYAAPVAPGRAHGVVRVGFTDDGSNWQWRALGSLPHIQGLPQSAFKPTLAVSNGVVFVGFHGLEDVDKGASLRATVGTYYSLSYDAGDDFTAPAAITAARWFPTDLAADANGAGLRERADFGPDGIVRYAYGDGRLAAEYPGRSAVFVALVDPGTR